MSLSSLTSKTKALSTTETTNNNSPPWKKESATYRRAASRRWVRAPRDQPDWLAAGWWGAPRRPTGPTTTPVPAGPCGRRRRPAAPAARTLMSYCYPTHLLLHAQSLGVPLSSSRKNYNRPSVSLLTRNVTRRGTFCKNIIRMQLGSI